MENTKKPKEKKEYVKEKLRQKRKESKKNKHRARLVVRNLPFAATAENLREHFEKFGEIDEVKVLKKEDGKLLGCGFVQFNLVQKAAKARHHLNGKPFLDREIECDWALPKNKYDKKKETEEPVKIKEEPLDDGYATVIKTETEETVKQEDPDEDLQNDDDIEEGTDSDEVEEVDEDDDDMEPKEEDEDDMEENDDYESDLELKDEEDQEEEITERKPHVVSNDATEGRTIFIKNVPFTATNDDVRSCFTQFGPLYYALVCMDSLTEHSKGTAFVKFRNKEDADDCLAALGITLMGHNLECHYALTKDDLKKKANEKNDKGSKQRDSRNLYLVKEGVVLAGSKAAEGVSAADMAKRLQIEQYKTQMLKNLNMFVARTRLIVHNVPASWDDAKLRALFTKHVGAKGAVKETRVMRNMRLLDGWGIGKSKEFGFVTFTTHEAALEALRAVNNNPNIFSASKRPIVAFSIENRAKLQAREKRLQNSRIKNPNYQNYDANAAKQKKRNEIQRGTKRPLETNFKEEHNNSRIKKPNYQNYNANAAKQKKGNEIQSGTKRPLEANFKEEYNKFSGVTATPGIKKMRSKFNLRTQAKTHHENLKKEKKKKKFAKKTLQQKQQEFTKQPRQKINKNKHTTSDNFSKLVNDYKQKLLNASASTPTKKKKWFE